MIKAELLSWLAMVRVTRLRHLLQRFGWDSLASGHHARLLAMTSSLLWMWADRRKWEVSKSW